MGMGNMVAEVQKIENDVQTSRRQAMLKQELFEKHAEDLLEHLDDYQSDNEVSKRAWQEGALAARAMHSRLSIALRQTLFDESKFAHSLREALVDETACAAVAMRSQRELQDKLEVQRRHALDTDGRLRASLEHALREELCAFLAEKQTQEQEAAIEQQLRGLEDQMTCCICMANPRNAAVAPCHHYAFCEGCSQRLVNARCPICRVAVTSVVAIHNA